MQNALEKVNDKHHDDDFAKFVLELVKRVHLEDFALLGLLKLLDLGDKQLINAEAKDVKHERHEVEVDRAHDLADDVGVEVLRVKVAEKVVVNGDENLAYVVASDDEKHDRTEQSKHYWKRSVKLLLKSRIFSKALRINFLCLKIKRVFYNIFLKARAWIRVGTCGLGCYRAGLNLSFARFAKLFLARATAWQAGQI